MSFVWNIQQCVTLVFKEHERVSSAEPSFSLPPVKVGPLVGPNRNMADLNTEMKRLHLDDVLGQLGAFGRHQAVTMAMLALVYATNSMYNVNYVFAVEEVGYR